MKEMDPPADIMTNRVLFPQRDRWRESEEVF